MQSGGEERMAEGDVMKQIYEDYDKHQFKSYKVTKDVQQSPLFRQIERLVGTGKRVLDIGASCGDFSLFLAQNRNTVVGLDISSKAVELCKQRGLEAHQVNIETEPLPKLDPVDVVLLLEVIEHLMDPLPVLRKIATVLKPSGFLLLSTPNAAYFKWRLQLLRGVFPDFGEARSGLAETRPYNLLHKTPLTIPDLRQTLRLSGFQIVHLEPTEYLASTHWRRPGLRSIRRWVRRAWPSMFSGGIVVKATKCGDQI